MVAPKLYTKHFDQKSIPRVLAYANTLGSLFLKNPSGEGSKQKNLKLEVP